VAREVLSTFPIGEPHLGRGRERRTLPDGHVVGVEAVVGGVELRVEPHPAVAVVPLGDDVVDVEARGAEVVDEPQAGARRDAVLTKHRDREQRVVAAAAADLAGERSWRAERQLGCPFGHGVEDPADPPRVDVGELGGCERRGTHVVVHDDVRHERVQARRICGECCERGRVAPRV
jgi:hypothetical protein